MTDGCDDSCVDDALYGALSYHPSVAVEACQPSITRRFVTVHNCGGLYTAVQKTPSVYRLVVGANVTRRYFYGNTCIGNLREKVAVYTVYVTTCSPGPPLMKTVRRVQCAIAMTAISRARTSALPHPRTNSHGRLPILPRLRSSQPFQDDFKSFVMFYG